MYRIDPLKSLLLALQRRELGIADPDLSSHSLEKTNDLERLRRSHEHHERWLHTSAQWLHNWLTQCAACCTDLQNSRSTVLRTIGCFLIRFLVRKFSYFISFWGGVPVLRYQRGRIEPCKSSCAASCSVSLMCDWEERKSYLVDKGSTSSSFSSLRSCQVLSFFYPFQYFVWKELPTLENRYICR